MRTLLALAVLAVGLPTAASCSKPVGTRASNVETAAPAPVTGADRADGHPESAGLPAGASCSHPIRQGTGVTLQPGSGADRRVFGLIGTKTCLWKVGDIPFDDGRVVGVFRVTAGGGPGHETFDGLYFSRDHHVFMGQIDIPDAAVKIEGRAVVLEVWDEEGAQLEWIPIGPDGPSPDLGLFSSRAEYSINDSDRSEVAYERALREPLGSRRSGPCSAAAPFYRLAAPSVRRALVGRPAFPPSSLDGSHCIWKVGVLTNTAGRRYGVYIHGWEGGANQGHTRHRLVLLEGDQRYVGSYDIGNVLQTKIRGATVLLGSDTPGEQLVIGPNGPPASIQVDGQTSPLRL